ncbi:uncharacterized protein E0L32_004227 [Thyridium curvatum]|uniref:NAD(+) diphosphatase n=1 Tax=Thyridium curvatum TaxID=1093900 RepID=A0A507BDU5_9PEZI|nr:uncharacterized protein E0L32_004227 [Thyridium curvatum]TPX15529.1 hypothetical protein E0L32_004227 [Thyridium curvatum]
MASALPDLPVLPVEDSMLSRRFGREIANYWSGGPLNRVAFLRHDHAFLQQAFSHPSTRFMLLDNLAPAISREEGPAGGRPKLAFARTADVVPLTGPEPFAKTEEEMLAEFNSDVDHPLILLLGIDEHHKLAASDDAFHYKEWKGSPYFAVDVTPKGKLADKANQVIEAAKAKGLTFYTDARSMGLVAPEAGTYAQARSILDWNARNPFCAGCGSRTLSVNAGMKRACPPTDLAGGGGGGKPARRPDCPTRQGVSNLSFPRTDPTVIMACVSADGTKMLLGRNKRFPPNMYSVLAGFLEPGESIEEAVRREIYEESGVTAARVVIYASQPWPFPNSLMIGAISQAAPGDGERIFLGNDPELDDARWFPLDEVRHALETSAGPLGQPPPPTYVEGGIRLPPKTAIAHQLILAVLNGYLSGIPKI